MRVEVMTPEEHLGDVISDVQSRRGAVEAIASRSGTRVVTALVPLRTLFGHVSDLRSRTRGRASASMALASYARAPDEVRQGLAGQSSR
jgi:elongation factor G